MRDRQLTIDADAIDLVKETRSDEVLKIWTAEIPVEYRNRFYDALEVRATEMASLIEAASEAFVEYESRRSVA